MISSRDSPMKLLLTPRLRVPHPIPTAVVFAASVVSTAIFVLLVATALTAQTAPSAPTHDQRALKALAEARDLVAAGRPGESIPFYGHALDLAEAELDEPSVALANLLAEYGDVLVGSGHRQRARASLERSLEMLAGLVDDDDSQRAPPLLGLGRLDAEETRCEQAKERLTQGLELLGSGSVRLAVSARVALGHCAETATSRPDLDTAFNHYRDAVLAAREASIETPEVATALHRGAAILLGRGETNAAVNYFGQALEMRKKHLGESDWHTADSAYQLARALDQGGRRGDARETIDQAIQNLGRACAPTSQSPSEVRDLCTNLAAFKRQLAGVPSAVAQQRTAPDPDAAADRPVAAPPTAQPQTRFRAQTQASQPAATTGPAWRVQVSSQQSPAEAERVAERVRGRFPDLLRPHPLTLERVELASGVWHRVLFGSFRERDDAVALCDSLKRAGLEACLPSRSE